MVPKDCKDPTTLRIYEIKARERAIKHMGLGEYVEASQAMQEAMECCKAREALKLDTVPDLTWQNLGMGYPGTEVGPQRVFDVLAPLLGHRRFPVYEQGHEETPIPLEVWQLATKISDATELSKLHAFVTDLQSLGISVHSNLIAGRITEVFDKHGISTHLHKK